ncbi:DUF4326 domain-containing protein [Micromonospora sp. NPDC005223]|uniref:DUF4326 domain-containing protein n=1 Tax=Micromonospora sp. NPDC005223 TaxID=3364227 RepID=UPI0036A2B077
MTFPNVSPPCPTRPARSPRTPADLDRHPDLVAARPPGPRRDLAGVDLACWCRQDVLACHGDVLLRVAAGATPQAAATAVLGEADAHQTM